jgi:hypothetical protein
MSGPVQVTLTFTSIALAVAALAKLDPVGIIVSGNPPSEGNVGAAGATDAPAPAQTGKGKSTSAKSSSAAPAAAASSATKPEAASTPAAASAPATTATSASTGSAPAGDFYAANFLPQKLAVLCSPSVNERAKVVELLAKFGAKKGNEVKAEDMPTFLVSVNELLVNSTNATTAATALMEGVGGVTVPPEHIPARAEEDLT